VQVTPIEINLPQWVTIPVKQNGHRQKMRLWPPEIQQKGTTRRHQAHAYDAKPLEQYLDETYTCASFILRFIA